MISKCEKFYTSVLMPKQSWNTYDVGKNRWFEIFNAQRCQQRKL